MRGMCVCWRKDENDKEVPMIPGFIIQEIINELENTNLMGEAEGDENFHYAEQKEADIRAIARALDNLDFHAESQMIRYHFFREV